MAARLVRHRRDPLGVGGTVGWINVCRRRYRQVRFGLQRPGHSANRQKTKR
ncbi:hypothetical protein [Azospirillum argentinense]